MLLFSHLGQKSPWHSWPTDRSSNYFLCALTAWHNVCIITEPSHEGFKKRWQMKMFGRYSIALILFMEKVHLMRGCEWALCKRILTPQGNVLAEKNWLKKNLTQNYWPSKKCPYPNSDLVKFDYTKLVTPQFHQFSAKISYFSNFYQFISKCAKFMTVFPVYCCNCTATS